jgi:hypothetical protein
LLPSIGLPTPLRRPRAYRKEWDESRGVWKDRPRHDEASHGADAFLTFACSNYKLPSPIPIKKAGLQLGGLMGRNVERASRLGAF